MSNHGDTPFETVHDPATFEQMNKMRKELLGATQRFPEGKLAEGDKGEIMFAVGHEHGKVMLEFGKAVAWIHMTTDQAQALAMTIYDHAEKSRIIGSDKKSTDVKATART